MHIMSYINSSFLYITQSMLNFCSSHMHLSCFLLAVTQMTRLMISSSPVADPGGDSKVSGSQSSLN